jgi:hypothetical protein
MIDGRVNKNHISHFVLPALRAAYPVCILGRTWARRYLGRHRGDVETLSDRTNFTPPAAGRQSRLPARMDDAAAVWQVDAGDRRPCQSNDTMPYQAADDP